MTPITEIDEVTREATLELAVDNIAKLFNKQLSDLQKNASIPGFRKGKVPSSLIKDQYKDRVIIDSISEAINNCVTDFFISNGLESKTYGSPELDWDFSEEIKSSIYASKPNEAVSGLISIKMKFFLYPNPEVTIPEPLEIEVPKRLLKEDLVEDFIQKIRKSLGKPVELEDQARENVIEGDFVDCSITITLGHGEKSVNQTENLSLLVEENSESPLAPLLVGKKIGEPFDFKTGIFKDPAFKTDCTVLKIYKFQLPELDDDLAKSSLFEVNTLEELREKIREIIQKDIDKLKDYEAKKAVTEALILANNFALPKTMVREKMQEIIYSQTGNSRFDLNKLSEARYNIISNSAEKLLRNIIIVDKLAKRWDINANVEEEQEFIDSWRDENEKRFIVSSEPYDSFRRQSIRHGVKENKIAAKLLNQCVINEVEPVESESSQSSELQQIDDSVNTETAHSL
jgi:trigger factor